MAKTIDTGLNRRKMMLAAGGVVAGASALMAAPFREDIRVGIGDLLVGVDVDGPVPSLATATYEEWESVVGTDFALGGGVILQLVGVRALPTSGEKPGGVREQGFAALFDPVSRQSVAPDLIYTATHPTGPAQIFLAATSDPRTPRRLVAVFN